MRWRPFLVIAIVLAACSPASSSDTTGEGDGAVTTQPPSVSSVETYPPPPGVPDTAVDDAVVEEVGSVIASLRAGGLDEEAIGVIGESGDARLAWFIADLLRFFQGGPTSNVLVRTFTDLTGADPEAGGRLAFVGAFNHLIAWDLPAWDGYDMAKRDLYTTLEPGWAPFFDENVSIDWRWVTWGGVLIDDRPLGDPNPCLEGCIPALDDPPTVPAGEVDWLSDDFVVFGIEHEGETLALPKNQMEVHEMVNITLGGDRLGIPYCTLCGSAQAYLTGAVPAGFDTVVLRTSGLLSRSNKVMYDLNTNSVFDTFTGEALSGPLGEAGVVLDQVTVIASTWSDWREAHPDTRVLAEDGGLGRDYEANPLGDRDAFGPIFPVGPVDPRLPVQEKVLGVVGDDGTAVAFAVGALRSALETADRVEFEGVVVVGDGSGFRVVGETGGLASHEAFWFAWSQFHPDTLLWHEGGG